MNLAYRSASAPASWQTQRQQRRHLGLVAAVGVAEPFDHPAFLQPGLAPQREPGDRDGEHAAPFVARQRGTEEAEQQAGVDRMAHMTIWADAHQFVILLQRDRAAPVAAERAARPYRAGET